MQANTTSTQTVIPNDEALAWIKAGFARVGREPARWLGMTLVYLFIALVLKRIPFLGNFVLALFTPVALASAMIAARSTLQPTPRGARAWWRALTTDGARELVQVFRREEQAFAIVIVCVVTLGLVVLLNIPELLITGGSVISGIAGANLGGPLRPMTVVNIAVALALYGLLAMMLFYLVPLVLFGKRHAIPAAAESFQTCVRQRKVLALFVAPFLGINFLITLSFTVSHEIGYLLLAFVGTVALPAFIVGLHESYRTLFEAPVPAAVTAAVHHGASR